MSQMKNVVWIGLSSRNEESGGKAQTKHAISACHPPPASPALTTDNHRQPQTENRTQHTQIHTAACATHGQSNTVTFSNPTTVHPFTSAHLLSEQSYGMSCTFCRSPSRLGLLSDIPRTHGANVHDTDGTNTSRSHLGKLQIVQTTATAALVFFALLSRGVFLLRSCLPSRVKKSHSDRHTSSTLVLATLGFLGCGGYFAPRHDTPCRGVCTRIGAPQCPWGVPRISQPTQPTLVFLSLLHRAQPALRALPSTSQYLPIFAQHTQYDLKKIPRETNFFVGFSSRSNLFLYPHGTALCLGGPMIQLALFRREQRGGSIPDRRVSFGFFSQQRLI